MKAVQQKPTTHVRVSVVLLWPCICHYAHTRAQRISTIIHLLCILLYHFVKQ